MGGNDPRTSLSGQFYHFFMNIGIKIHVPSLIAYRKYFQGSGDPFSITVAGVELYIVTSSRDMSLVYKNTTSLSFDDFIRDLHIAFGLSAAGLRTMWDKSNGKCLVHVANDLHHAQLLPGKHLDDLTQRFLVQIERRLTWEFLLAHDHRVARGAPTQVTLSLYDWCAQVLVPAASVAFFGEAMLRINQNLIEDFLAFDEDSWMLTYRYPRFLARKMYHGMQGNTDAFTRYFGLPLEERPDACHYVTLFEARERSAAMSDRDVAITIQLFYWVSVISVMTWLIADTPSQHQRKRF